ncbi:MAG: hypothetical protein AAF570_14905 [Bacteroidota bacterium]
MGPITGTDSVDTQVFLGQIRQSPIRPGGHAKTPVWSENVRNGTLDVAGLGFHAVSMPGCAPQSLKVADRHFLLGQMASGGVLVIRSGDQTMYLVLPDPTLDPVSRHFSEKAATANFEANFQPEKHGFYTPDIDFGAIQFQAGIFFLPELYPESLGFPKARHSVDDLIGFHAHIQSRRPSPKEYWQETVRFEPIWPLDSSDFVLKFPGQYSEAEALALVLRHQPVRTREIVEHVVWETFVQKTVDSPEALALRDRLLALRKTYEAELQTLLQAFETGEITAGELAERRRTLQATRFQPLLSSDAELALGFCKFLRSDERDVPAFEALFEGESFKVQPEKVKAFLNVIDKR